MTAFTADEARKLERREQSRAQKKKIADDRKRRAADKKDMRWAMKELYPKDLEEIKRDIKKQIKFCAEHHQAARSIMFNMPGGSRHNAYLNQLKKDLPGFTFSKTYIPPSRENMGDFNAPCMVDGGNYYVLHISWEH